MLASEGEKQKLKERLALAEAELRALEINQLRAITDAEMLSSAGLPSILKIMGSEVQQQLGALLLDIVGPTAEDLLPTDGLSWLDEAATTLPSAYLHSRAVSIYGGSNEIQRNIVAKAYLGL
jgi:alkylation response protein AidB-like acyl-CoA dehydrogenase